ncbi:SprT family zinc-dependent metalloprotease [Thalassovita sp.]|uniref:M48 family metallopeptidase n=1 Tax=Thalassovita sp. TaxID=1979401 RepID=UPI002AB26047|nr:SprT family zinc-dependent metalloprotease [Thalassovita sp.]
MPKQKGDNAPHVLAGDPPVEVHLRRSAQARRLSLRVSGLDAKVTLTLPNGVAERQGLAFAAEKAEWLRRQIASRPEVVDVGIGCELPIYGQPYQVLAGQGRRIVVRDQQILVPGNAETAGRRLAAFLKALAREQLAAASDRYAADLKRPYSRISLRDTRSRWGSCSSAGVLMYSWRLVMAPMEVLEYVAAHEVAHLRHMDHSAAFWRQVEELYGDYSAARGWLRENGSELHRYRFGN